MKNSDSATPCHPIGTFSIPIPGGQYEFILRPLLIPQDLDIIHRWIHQPYARKFWDMEVGLEELYETYSRINSGEDGHSYLGWVDQDPVCQLDVYQVQAEEISGHYPVSSGDFGIHLLMCPDRSRVPDLSVHCIRACLAFLFSYPVVERVIAEPDILHRAANLVARRAGFMFCKQVQLSRKKANLYCCTREKYQQISSAF